MDLDPKDVDALIREKYQGNKEAPGLEHDKERLSAGEPLAYVIGHIPFLGLTIGLESHPLIPRPETEWWTEELCTHIGDRPLRILDLCAGSGAIGLAILARCPNATVSFGELMEEHEATIRKNVRNNGIDAARTVIHTGDLFAPFTGERFDIVATNPPYIPKSRELPHEVSTYEPNEALHAGEDGLGVIRRILKEAPEHINAGGEMWMECDIANIDAASELSIEAGSSYTKIRTDQYGRPRLLISYY